jgi:hypothetical protein
MSERRDARHMLDLAEGAASAGDLASADELLRSAARIQEAELGPLHPDLANTLNNLAIVSEKTGRLGDAETFYRRATAIASASLPADHPMVAESRQNLEDFCRAHGVPIDAAAVMTPSARETEPGPDAFAVEDVASPHAPRASSRPRAWLAIGVVVLVTSALLARRQWSSRATSTPAPIAAQTTPQAADPAPAPSAMPAPIEQAQPPKVVPRGDDRNVITDTARGSAPSSDAITLTTAQLCEAFSTSGGSWRCEPAGDSVAPGPIVLYTQARSLRDAAVVHRWYRGDTLRQSVKLAIRANPTAGYRTYSRQTVDGGDWRVEVRSENGDLLYERRFAVR